MITLFTSHFAYITIDSPHVTKSGQVIGVRYSVSEGENAFQ